MEILLLGCGDSCFCSRCTSGWGFRRSDARPGLVSARSAAFPCPLPLLSSLPFSPSAVSCLCDAAPLAEMIVLSPVLGIFLESRVNLHAGPLPGAALPR